MDSQTIKMNGTKKFKEYYQDDSVTGTYDKQRLGNLYRIQKRQKELEMFLNLLDKKKGEKVLELGCSSGFLAKELGEVWAVDTSPKMLEITKQKNPRAIIKEADMFHLPFEDNSFDKVVTMRVWNHLKEEDLRRALKESKRVLKPNGILVFDIEEKNWSRRFINFFYKKIFRITGFKVYQYSFLDIQIISYEEGFKIDDWRILKHRIGNQIIIKFKKEL